MNFFYLFEAITKHQFTDNFKQTLIQNSINRWHCLKKRIIFKYSNIIQLSLTNNRWHTFVGHIFLNTIDNFKIYSFIVKP